jgi:hypothetical protein
MKRSSKLLPFFCSFKYRVIVYTIGIILIALVIFSPGPFESEKLDWYAFRIPLIFLIYLIIIYFLEIRVRLGEKTSGKVYESEDTTLTDS